MSGLDFGFDKRWEKHAKPQATTSKRLFWEKTGVMPGELRGKTVLDAGCGCGRFSSMLADAGANVIGIDASPHAIDAAKENCPGGSFYLADLLDKLPVDGVDFAYSIGVLHHTANPELGLRNIVNAVKPGGEVAIWVYSTCLIDPRFVEAQKFLHSITKALPPEKLYEICKEHAVSVRNEYRASSMCALSQVLSVSFSDDEEECISDTFDWHCPQYRSLHSANDVSGWFERCGCEIVWQGEFPVSARGRKK